MFQEKKRKGGILFYLAVSILIFGFFIHCSTVLGQKTGAQTTVYLEDAIRKAAVHCYAIEGQYPENLEYLKKNYGLVVNHKNYIIEYRNIGANIMPDIFVARSGDHELH